MTKTVLVLMMSLLLGLPLSGCGGGGAGDSVSGILHTTFGETNAAKSGFRIDNGFELMEYFLKS